MNAAAHTPDLALAVDVPASAGVRGSALPRGTVKAFRTYLNGLGGSPHRHNRYHQKTRPYGDYLYAQDREKFMVDLQQWLQATQNVKTVPPAAGRDE